MTLDTVSQPFRRALATDSTDSAFPSRIPTGTEPTGNGVIDLAPVGGGVIPNAVLLVPIGTGGDNDTFSVRLIGWRRLGTERATVLWVPVVLVELACTLCAVVGVAGRLVAATERFADTLTLVTGNDDISIDIVSPTGDVVAHALTDLKGSTKFELTFDSTAAGTTAMNCLVALV